MSALKTAGAVRDREQALETLREDRCSEPRFWTNGAGDSYGWHAHGYHKVLFCLTGSIAFHVRDGEIELREGDRLDLEPDTEHSAIVGPHGVECVEASR